MLALRIVLGAVGLLSIMLAARIWLDPASIAPQLGVLVNGELGRATLRADIAGLFAATGGLSVAAALRADGRLLLGPVCLIVAALAGRLLNLVASGFTLSQVAPILIEVVVLAVLAAGFRGLRRPPTAVEPG
ncbi:MAG: hypothetical protein ACKOD3_01900 [Phenylobacterium sp.]